jgi:hypothetical protein
MGREVNDGRWHHAALTWDGTRRRLFQDGIKVAEDRPGPWTPTTCQFRIGAIANIDQELFYYGAMRSTQPLAYFDGTIAEVRLSNTDRYCGQNFTPKTGFAVDANTVGYWKLNEGSGTTIRDQTGHGHTGKLVGNPLPRWINDPPHLSPAKQRQFRQGGVLDQE